MKYHPSIKPLVFMSVTLVVFLYATALTTPALFAQASLQNSETNNNLQPQSSPNQQPTNTQNQVGTLQNNNGTTVLNQAGSRPLGVVSSPDQTEPDTVVTPSNTTKADIAKLENNSKMRPILLALGCLAIALIGIYVLRRAPRGEPFKNVVVAETVVEKPVIKPEPFPVKSVNKSRKQQRRKNKKKASRR